MHSMVVVVDAWRDSSIHRMFRMSVIPESSIRKLVYLQIGHGAGLTN